MGRGMAVAAVGVVRRRVEATLRLCIAEEEDENARATVMVGRCEEGAVVGEVGEVDEVVVVVGDVLASR